MKDVRQRRHGIDGADHLGVIVTKPKCAVAAQEVQILLALVVGHDAAGGRHEAAVEPDELEEAGEIGVDVAVVAVE